MMQRIVSDRLNGVEHGASAAREELHIHAEFRGHAIRER